LRITIAHAICFLVPSISIQGGRKYSWRLLESSPFKPSFKSGELQKKKGPHPCRSDQTYLGHNPILDRHSKKVGQEAPTDFLCMKRRWPSPIEGNHGSIIHPLGNFIYRIRAEPRSRPRVYYVPHPGSLQRKFLQTIIIDQIHIYCKIDLNSLMNHCDNEFLRGWLLCFSDHICQIRHHLNAWKIPLGGINLKDWI